jgi:hypothetical protein
VAGSAAGIAGTAVVVRIGGLLYPVRADPAIADRVTQLREAMAAAPIEAQLFIVAAFFVGGMAAALMARVIARANWPGIAAAAIVTLAAILVVLVLPLPGWVQAAAVVLPLVGALIVNKLVRRRGVEADSTAAATHG